MDYYKICEFAAKAIKEDIFAKMNDVVMKGDLKDEDIEEFTELFDGFASVNYTLDRHKGEEEDGEANRH